MCPTVITNYSTSRCVGESSTHIVQLFLEQSRKTPDKIAIISGKQSITFDQLEQQARKRLTALKKNGVRRGDAVLIYVPMSIALYETLIAILWMGAKAVFIDSWADHQRIAACLKQCPVDAVVADRKLRWIRPFYASLRSLPRFVNHAPASLAHTGEPQSSSDHVAIVTFTTGSTGNPKGAIRTHDFLHHQFEQLSKVITPNRHAPTLVSLPMVLLMNFASGATSIIPDISLTKPDFTKISRVSTQLQRHAITRIIASPALLLHLANDGPFPSIKEVFTGGGPVFPEEAVRLDRGFPNAGTRVIYGSTEAEPVSDISSQHVKELDDGQSIPVGQVAQHAEVRIIPLDYSGPWQLDGSVFEALCLPLGEVGEIVASGPQVLADYTNPKEVEANKLSVNQQLWHRMGDAGFIKEGQLFLLGRCSETIQTASGSTIYPFAFTRQSKGIPGVRDAILLEEGKELMVAVECMPGAERSAIETQLKRQWPDLQKVIFLDRIPRDPRHLTKVDMATLRKQVSRG